MSEAVKILNLRCKLDLQNVGKNYIPNYISK